MKASGVVIDTKDGGHVMFVRDGGDYKLIEDKKGTLVFDAGKLVCIIDTNNIDAIHFIKDQREAKG